MKKIIYGIFLIAAALQVLTAHAGPTVVVGEDGRAEAPADYPYRVIGRLTTRSGSLCTSFMVSKTTAVTNAHCVTNDKDEVLLPEEVEIYLDFHKKYFPAKRIAISKLYLKDKIKFDFAFIEIEEEAGHATGYFGTRSFDPSLARKDILQLSGYSLDVKNGWEKFRQKRLCRAEKPSVDGLIMHDCDMQKGASGAPVFIKVDEQFYVVGINSRQSEKGACASFHDTDCFNLAVPFQHISEELRQFDSSIK
ncbi:MAG: trypsin-like serine peptidase [Bacteriovoracaceae bacterium]